MQALKDHLPGLTLLVTRLLIASIFLWHGLPKAMQPAMAIDKFLGFGLPGFLGPVIGVAEVAGAVLLLIGFFHREANLLLAVVIAGAIITVRLPGGITAGLERDLLILVGALTLSLYGPGSLALDTKLQKTTSRRTSPTMPFTSPHVTSSQVRGNFS